VATAGLELCDHAEGSRGGGGGAPVREVAVLAPFQEVLAPLVVGPLVEDPGAIRYHGGVDFPELEGLENRRAILGALRRLAFETLPLVEPDLPGLSVYLERVSETKLMKACQCLVPETVTSSPSY